MKDKVSDFFNHRNNLELVLRVVQWFVAVVSFLCSTAVTGVGAGDFAFLMTYTLWVYTLLYIVLVLRQEKLSLLPLHKIFVDSGFTLSLFAAGIAVACSPMIRYCGGGGCGAAYACVVFLFVGSLTQGASVYITYTQEYRHRSSDEFASPPAAILQA
ncbi:hypothetical protein DYB37_003254 [Aphanomyces astaci]|uniref:MARVEL domain-containing protein n=1 Tax=Aphanomyces astaci TaxID=112090 RepID=A0A397D590_APHAT|nr:hypothetical protein DYB36_002936 [Aphanomyces astaci]RHY36421.1 hypothetical protein DYB25_000638 [Aphanomyces astaci]RHY55313.1 hypothetical protein DYB38_003718 [Aphanomyces astaci]RHY66635.1 hypothetical protein DYB34_003797 [Aphanomyces astaci]RHY74137.1 hypothetical protein DYB30_004267 [Aphanomyces astaci]